MPIVVMKFGGSCLKDKIAFEKIFRITNIYSDVSKIYVTSALNGITDLLLKTGISLENKKETEENLALIKKKHIDIIEEIFLKNSEYYNNSKNWIDEKLSQLEELIVDINEFGLEPYYKDYILSFGEILSTFILNQYLLSKELNSIYIPATKVIITNDEFNNAYPLYNLTSLRIKEKLLPFIVTPKNNVIICINGFIGRNKLGSITTLGRGGSDYTATIIARALFEVGKEKDIKVILWKDIDGLLAINPKFMPDSSLIKYLNYGEAKHIANFGAKVLHPKCLEAIEKYKIPLEIRNFDKPLEVNFTKISELTDKNQIKGISAVEFARIITVISGSMVDVPGVLAKIFKVMSKNSISVSLVAQSLSEISTSFIVTEKDSEKAIKALENSTFFSEFFKINWAQVAIINITGLKVLETKTKAEIFDCLSKNNINVKAITQSYNELNLSLVIDRYDLIKAINAIHKDLYEEFKSFD
ncbi:MAG: aspartate kinase [Promethearchaeota archaeon]